MKVENNSNRIALIIKILLILFLEKIIDNQKNKL